MSASSPDKLRDALLASLGSPARVKAYLQWALHRVSRQDLLDPKNLRRFEAQTQGGAAAAPAARSAPAAGGGASLRHKGLYPKGYRCLFDQTVFTAIKVKSSYETEEGAAGGADDDRALLFLLHGIQICPQCLFASADKNHFAFESPDPDKADLVPTPRQVKLVEDRFADREAIRKGCGPTLFSEERTPADGLAACRLAALSAQALYEGDPKRDPNLQRAIGRYLLNAAQLSLRLDDAAAATDLRRRALARFEEAYSVLQGPAAYETLFIMEKLASELDDPDGVQKFGGEARRLFDGRNQVIDGRERISLDKHLKKINAVYEDYFQRRGEDKHIMNV